LGGSASFLTELKADPGQLGVETMLKEISKLERVRAIGLPADLFADTWRSCSGLAHTSGQHVPLGLPELAPAHPADTPGGALCRARRGDRRPVDLLIALVLKIDTRAERRVEGELINDLKRVRGKEGILFRLAEAALEKPDEIVRRAF